MSPGIDNRVAAAADGVREPNARRLLAWPGWSHIRHAAWLGVLFAIWLELIYGLADYITGLRSYRVRLHFDWELAMPFVPATAVIYTSIFPLFWLGPFILRTRSEVRAVVESMALVTLLGGAGFLLFPAELAYAPEHVPDRWTWVYGIADMLNLRYNLAPSLHVALSVTCIDAYAYRATRVARVCLWSWGSAIALSTLLTHQHHVVDAVSGFALGMVVSRWYYRRRIATVPAASTGRSVSDGLGRTSAPGEMSNRNR